jgi:serine/threonine protein kinase
MTQVAIGSVIGGHRLESLLGRGGMGVVYEARDLDLDRVVALKLIAPESVRDERFRRRFKQEAKVVARLDHPGIIRIWRFGEDGGTLFVSMELVSGSDLSEHIQQSGPISPRLVSSLVTDIAEALDVAHANGIVHRDVKPSNVLLRDRAPQPSTVLTDFGLAKDTAANLGHSDTTGFVGTPAYAAPEQIEGTRVDARTDVYALGCVVYEMLTGQVPYARSTPIRMAMAHLEDRVPSPTAVAPSLPSAFDDVVARALAKKPNDRYPSAGVLARAVAAAVDDRPYLGAEVSVATGRAATSPPRGQRKRPPEPTPRTVVPPSPEVDLQAARRAAQREDRRRTERNIERARASLIRVAKSVNAPDFRWKRLLSRFNPGERAWAAMLCSVEGRLVENVLLVVTNQRVLWVRETVLGAPSYGEISGSHLNAVEADSAALYLIDRSGARTKFVRWSQHQIPAVAAAATRLSSGSA